MTESELVSIILSHRRDSLGYEDGELSDQRATAMDHYHGRPYGNEVKGRSQVVSRDLAETVDWAMPALMRTFTQAGSIAEFDPVGPEDEAQAQQESDYVHQVVMKDNQGVMLIHDTLKEAMLLKNCYAKHWWSVEKKSKKESYTGLTMEQITAMLEALEAYGAEVQILGQTSKMVPLPGMPQQMNEAQQIQTPAQVEVFDIKLRITEECSRLRIEAVPVEEVRVSKKCRGSLQDSPFVEHHTTKRRSDLIEMGMDRGFVDSLPAYREDENETQANARSSVHDETNTETGTSVNDRAMDEIEYAEAFIRVDYDGDGVAELRRVVTCGGKRIPPGEEWNDEIEACALTGGVIKRIPHRHTGESLDDELADLQEIMTTLKRQMLDNVYLTNHSQLVVNERANLKDLMTATPGGIKRVKGLEPVSGSIEPLVTKPIIGDILPVLDYFNKVKETRSGIRPGSDMDPDILRESTKGAFLEHLNRASQKIELIARLYAETFVKELILQVHGLLNRHQDQQRMVQLRGKWVPVNPRHWKERTDLSVKVGLGTGNEEEKRQKLLLLTQMQDRLAQGFGLVGPGQAYALFEDIVKALGFDVPEKYAMTPGSPEHQQAMQQQQQQPNPEMAKVQGQQQLEQMRMQMQMQTDRNRQEMEAQQQQAKMMMERELGQFKAQLQMQLESQRMQIKAETDIAIARINASAKIDSAQLTAQTTLSAQQETATDNAVNQ